MSSDNNNGFNLPPMLQGREITIQPIEQTHTLLGSMVYGRDWVRSGISENLGDRRDLIIVKHFQTGDVFTRIEPTPKINRLGTKSKPFRILGGNEVTLSEDDIRVDEISKRYKLSDIWAYGCEYIINPVYTSGNLDLSKSTVCELIFVDDSKPLTWSLTLRKKLDSRSNGAMLGAVLIP